MKRHRLYLTAWAGFLFAALSGVSAGRTSPLQKVITLMTQLQGQVISEGETAQSTYKKYSSWCEKSSREKQIEIQESGNAKSELEAAIEKSTSDGEEAQARVEELSGGLATDAQDSKAITLIRVKEKNDFEEMDKQMTSTVTIISKARSVLKKQLAKAGLKAAASFLQSPTKGMQLFADAVNALVTTSVGISADSRDKLTELLQTSGDSEDADDDSTEEDGDDSDEKESASLVQENGGAPPKIAKPKEEVYQSKSGGIMDLLEKMEEEAQASQAKLRKKETKEKHSYELLKARLEDRIKTQEKELEGQKKELAMSKEAGATSKGKLEATAKDLVEDKKFLKKLQQGCMERASEFQMEVKTRDDELNALGSAKKTVQSIVFLQLHPAEETDASSASFLQVEMDMSTEAYALRTAGVAVASRLQQLAGDEHSVALAQLASRVSSTLNRLKSKGSSGADPFKKIKGLIQNMIAKLEKQQAGEAQQKKFCDKELAESKAGKIDREGTIETMTTRIEEGVADTAKLNQQRTMLLGEIKDIETSQGEMDGLRQEEHASYKKVTKELKEGLQAVQTALKVLREFYSQEDEGGASFIQDMSASMRTASADNVRAPATGGTAIIGLLEVCESDFSKGLAESSAEEDAAQDEYEKLTLENKKERGVKDKTVVNVGTEVARIEKKVSEFTGDRGETKQELDALLEYIEKLNKQCVAQPESYHDRVARRKREIEGLESALDMLVSQDAPQAEE